MRHARRALAASFVVTFAGGCDSKATQPPAAPTVDVGPAPVPAAASASAASATPDAGATAPSQPDTASAAILPPAPSVGFVRDNGDGTCSWFPDRRMGRAPGGGRVMVNPPPPRRVQCPPGDGGT